MFNLFRKFILVFKKIFHILSEPKYEKKADENTQPIKKEAVEVLPTKEKSGEVSLQEEKPEEVPQFGNKTEITSVPEGIPSHISPKDEPDEVKPPEGKPLEVPSIQEIPPELPQIAQEEITQKKSKGEDETRTRKPYKKKPPTERTEEEREKALEYDEKKPVTPKHKKEIDLGKIKRREQPAVKQPQQRKELDIERIEKSSDEKETLIRVESPYVEIDLDEAKVFLIIPKQQFRTEAVDNISQQLDYKLELNGKEEPIAARVIGVEKGILTVEEKKIELEQPIKNFKIVYPDELQGRVYSYHHSNEILYAFIAIGNNCGRMHYLYDNQANFNPLPTKRDIWCLIKEGFDLSIQPDVIEETWIWEKYRLMCINLKNINELVIKNNQTGEENKIPCEPSFSIECGRLVEDDFKEQSPIFVGNIIKIIAPIENKDGWTVWLQNKLKGYKLVTDNWIGDKPLELKLPECLPCECGEFQIDICEKEDRIPIETLFFRYITNLQLEYPQELVIPNPNTGHKQELIKILMEKYSRDWKLKIYENMQFKRIENGYQIELPPDQGTLHFSLVKEGKPETETNFKITVPRLKWKTSKMTYMTDKPLRIKRDELIPGTDFYFLVATNDFRTKYDFKSILEMNSQRLQEEKLTRKGMVYALLLNNFYDTIRENESEVKLSIEIRKAKGTEVLAQVEVIQLPSLPEAISYDLINILSLPKICFILRRIKATCRKEKSACKNILQTYYQNIMGRKKAKREVIRDKKDFVIKALAFIKFIMNFYGENVQIKGQRKWKRRINFLQQKHPEEFDNAYKRLSGRL